MVVASDFGGLLTQAELNILNARSGDIINFLNQGGGLYAMGQSNDGAGLTPDGGHFGFLRVQYQVSSDRGELGEGARTGTALGGGRSI